MTLTPGFVDSHTHAVFGRYRTDEYAQRSAGVPYMEIARRGGGINASVRDLRARSEDELVELALPRLREMLEWGTTTAEALVEFADEPLVVIGDLGEAEVVLVGGVPVGQIHRVVHQVRAHAAEHQVLVVVVLERLGRGGRGLAPRLGIAYPLARRFRTSMLLGMFSLVIFTVTIMTVMSASIASGTT